MKNAHYFWLCLVASPNFIYANDVVTAPNSTSNKPTSSTAATLEAAVANGQLLPALAWGTTQQKNRSLSTHEQQILAKTARQVGQLPLAQAHYTDLSHSPDQAVAKDGLLGLILTDIDARHSVQATAHAQQYTQQFGQDAQWQEANRYHEQTFGQGLQDALTTQSDQNITLAQYKQAAQENRFLSQERLQSKHPNWFDANDAAWLQVAQAQEIAASIELNSVSDQQLLQQTKKRSITLGQQAPLGSALQQAALQAALDASLRLSEPQDAIDAYAAWFPEEAPPASLQAAYAKNLLDNHQHQRALKQFRALPVDAVDDDVRDRIVAALADAGLMSHAQKQLDAWPTNATQNDYTHNYRLSNPYHQEKPFWYMRLLDWNGHHNQANHLINAYLDTAPADTNALKLKGDLRRWQGFGDDALQAYDEAAYFLHPDELMTLEGSRATVYLDQDNRRAARAAIAKLPDYQPIKQDLLQRLALQDAAYWQSQAVLSNTTNPANTENEWRIQSRLASQRSENGLRFYTEHDVQVSPHNQEPLRAQRVGVGIEWNRYPTQWDIAIGSGTELNREPYLHLGVNHRFNQYLSTQLQAQKNSESIPLKALEQDVYANALMASLNLHLHADVDAGLGVSVNDFDDGNVRQETYAFISSTVWQRDRWSVKNYSRIDWQKNRAVAQAAYYNPQKAWSYGTEFGLQYRYPFDHQITMTNVLSGGIGRYHQQNEATETTWLVRYNQQWDFQDRYSLGFHLGRKRAIYDGHPEYSNFVGLNTQFRF